VSPVEAICPACGAPVSFKIGSSIVVICEFCNSVVARADRRLEDLGKVADLAETGSPLDIGLKGVYQRSAFELTGRAQLGHQAGGVWDEWYAAFADGRWGWLAEAQGRFYLTFEQALPEPQILPPFNRLELGAPVAALPIPLMVAEKGEARALGAKGEIPYRLVPGEQHVYADLSGPHGEFATLDYSEAPPSFFVGREVTLEELGIHADAHTPEREARRVAAAQLSCPQCGGPLALHAPDVSERVTCPNCGSLLDVSHGRLEFMQALHPGKVVPIIPIGSVGEWGGVKTTVIGFVERSVEFEGVRYFWEEYLLYNPQVGFRWLVRSDDNWTFVEPLQPGAVAVEPSGRRAQLNGKSFKLFQDAAARVEYVIGEFYWKVAVGETVRAADYVNPPQMLSVEVTGSAPGGTLGIGTGEVNWSLGTYVSNRDIEKAFGIRGLPNASKIAPNQPYSHKAIYKYWGLLLLAAFLIGLVVIATSPRRKVFEGSFQLQPLTSSEGTQAVFSEPFELKGRKNIEVAATANIDNSWLAVDGDLIQEDTGEVQPFELPIEYYYGVEDGESWSEGSKTASTHLSALPEGKYTLRLEAQWEKWQTPATLNVRVEQGVPNVGHLFIAMALISVIPIIMMIYHYSFEKRRWSDSDYSPFGS